MERPVFGTPVLMLPNTIGTRISLQYSSSHVVARPLVKVYVMVLSILLILPLFVTGQFPPGPPGGAGSGVDPVSIILSSPTALRPCYSFSGKDNNLENTSWGAINDHLLRPEGHRYADDDWSNMPQGVNPRVISNALSHETCAQGTLTAEQCLNDWFWVWGQTIDHDMAQVPVFPKQAPNDHELNVDISLIGDPNDPFLSGRKFPHRRSFVEPSQPMDQINIATAYLDCSQVYGASVLKADSVRTFQNGMLKMTRDGFMPVLSSSLNLNYTNVPTFDELGHPSHKDQFLCADMRCNQHAPMAAMQTIFIREHNRIALALANARHPAYNNDETIYQAARAAVIAMTQAITYNEFLPLALGPFNVPPYTGYKPHVRAGITNAFITAGFRVMHSMVGCDFKEMNGQGQTLRSVNFASAFFDSTWIRGPPAQPNRPNREANAYQSVTNALAFNPSTHMDHKVAPVLRSVLFSGITTPRGRRPDVAFDVIASDVLRGRDHGLLDYRSMRRALGWADIRSVDDITLQADRRAILRGIYGDDIDTIDLFVGLINEDPIEGATFGPVTSSIIRDQFERIRDGDRCWYENQFGGALLGAFRGTRLKHLVDRNFNTPNNPFASEITIGTLPTRPEVELSPIQAHATGLTPVVITSPSSVSGGGSINGDGQDSSNGSTIIPIPSATNIPSPPPLQPPSPLQPPQAGQVSQTTRSDGLNSNGNNNALNRVTDIPINEEDQLTASSNPTANFDAARVVGSTEGVIAGSTVITNNPNTDEHIITSVDGIPVGVLNTSDQHDGNGHDNVLNRVVHTFTTQGTGDSHQFSDTHQHNDSVVINRNAHLNERDIAHRRYNERRSRLDNGVGVRVAGPLDDIVGYRCDGPDCHPVALESDPVIDDELIAIAHQIREQRRQQQRQQELFMFGTTSIASPPSQNASHDVSLLSLQQQRHIATFQHGNQRLFSTLQTQPGTSTAIQPTATTSSPAGFTTTVIAPNGLQQLSPLSGIRQAGIRSPLASVSPNILVDNIFLTPQCRR